MLAARALLFSLGESLQASTQGNWRRPIGAELADVSLRGGVARRPRLGQRSIPPTARPSSIYIVVPGRGLGSQLVALISTPINPSEFGPGSPSPPPSEP